MLKSDVALARDRVTRLKRELEQIRAEMTYTQRGVETLSSVEQKLSASAGGKFLSLFHFHVFVLFLIDLFF